MIILSVGKHATSKAAAAGVAPGSKRKAAEIAREGEAMLQKLAAGGKAPAHTHRGNETTLVLQGAFADQNGVFRQWDFVALDQHHEHTPVAVGCEDCITLSVLSAPVRLTGRFTRLLNPFLRF